VTAAVRQGWRIIPIYVGYQAPCTGRSNVAKFTSTTAAILGTADAADAVLQAQALGMLPGSAIYGDTEHYGANDSACRSAVLSYVSAWTTELHRQGYLAGMYANLSSGAKHLSEAYASTAYARPDALWIARWNNSSSLTGWAGIPDTQWGNHQRGKQYRGDHDETHGGVRSTSIATASMHQWPLLGTHTRSPVWRTSMAASAPPLPPLSCGPMPLAPPFRWSARPPV
jgi:hypothetical protein